MTALNLKYFCDAVNLLLKCSDSCTETEIGCILSGSYSYEVLNNLKNIKEIISHYGLKMIHLQIDDIGEDWEDFDFDDESFRYWKVNISDKIEILEACSLKTSDIEVLIFFNIDYFENNWVVNASGLYEPEKSERFKDDKPLKIYVNNSDYFFGGSRIAVICVDKYENELPAEWMQSTRLPGHDQIKKNLHLVSVDNSFLLPEKLYINWGDFDNELARCFLRSFAVSLLMTLCQEYYGREKVVLKGSKRLEIELYSSLRSKSLDCDSIHKLIETVEWCFADKDESTRILLVIDRISLDLKEGGDLYSALPYFTDALDEAQERYKYVILDRKKDYTKELSDLQKDISTVVDKISAASLFFSSKILKDILTLAFLLTAGIAARKFIHEDALKSSEAVLLFKSFSIYLIVSLVFSLAHAIITKWQSTSLFKIWQSILRSHMSKQDLENKLNTALFPVNVHYWFTVILATLGYVVMAVICWRIQDFLRLFGMG